MTSSIELSETSVTDADVDEIRNAANKSSLRVLSLRECNVKDSQLNAILVAVASCKSIVQLSLCVGIVKSKDNISNLCKCLQQNRSLLALFIHGNPLKDSGMKKICKELSQHPHIVSLDISDCDITDSSMELISNLLPQNGAKPGLRDLSLGANPGISVKSWAKFGVALAASSNLRELYLDYNTLGDYAASCIIVGLSAGRLLQVLDLEGTSIGETTGQLLLHLVENFPVQLQRVILSENKIEEKTIERIKSCLDVSDELSDSMSIASIRSKTKSTVKTEVKICPVTPATTMKSGTLTSELTSTQKSSARSDNTEDLSSDSDHEEKSDKEKVADDDESELRDTVKTDEDYKNLEMALEDVGLSTGKISALSETMETEQDDVEEELTEVPVTSTSHVIHMTDFKKIHPAEPDDFDFDYGEELKEVPIAHQ